MLIRSAARIAAILLAALVPGVLFGALPPPSPEFGPVVPFDGRHYQVVKINGIDWHSANDIAESKVYEGVNGHLATLTSEAEDAFVDQLRRDAGLSRPEAWVGGFQEPCAEQPGCGWQWVNEEGPISTRDFPLPSYSNWLDDEPNNLGNKERHLGIGLRNESGWNDEGNLGNIGGFIVEYDTSSNISVIACTAVGGCQTTAGQSIELPPGVDPDGTLGVRTYEFTDPRALSSVSGERCGESALTLFADRGADQELSIPAYLCGSPKFLVVEVNTAGFEIQRGTILVENEPEVALPDNLYDCTGPFAQDPLNPDLDPQHRDVVAWQATDPADMRENDLGAWVDPMFAGALGEFTFECGSSRGKIKSASYYVIGMHINFGPGYELASNAAANHERFVSLTRYKLQLLQAAVAEARAAQALKYGDFAKMRAMLNIALHFHDRGRFHLARKTVNIFLRFVDKANYAAIPGENYQGEHDMRASNILFMYKEKVIPFAR